MRIFGTLRVHSTKAILFAMKARRLDRSLRELALGLRGGEFRSVDLLGEATETLEANEARLGAYKTRTPELAEAAANAADAAFRAGRDLGLLQGIPVSVKDIFGVPGVPIFAGSSRELPAKWQSPGPVARAFLDAGVGVDR